MATVLAIPRTSLTSSCAPCPLLAPGSASRRFGRLQARSNPGDARRSQPRVAVPFGGQISEPFGAITSRVGPASGERR